MHYILSYLSWILSGWAALGLKTEVGMINFPIVDYLTISFFLSIGTEVPQRSQLSQQKFLLRVSRHRSMGCIRCQYSTQCFPACYLPWWLKKRLQRKTSDQESDLPSESFNLEDVTPLMCAWMPMRAGRKRHCRGSQNRGRRDVLHQASETALGTHRFNEGGKYKS